MSKHPESVSYSDILKRDRLTERDHSRIAVFIQSTSGVQLPKNKSYLIETRLYREQRRLNFSTLKDYVNYVLSPAVKHDDRTELINSLTTNKTDFFREIDHFKYLAKHALPDRFKQGNKRPPEPIRVWSAGCSSGEEPYSLAMLLNERRHVYPELNFCIWATDISTKVLRIAMKGIYTHDRIEPIPLVLRKRYLLKARDDDFIVRVNKNIREHVAFGQFNLLKDPFIFSEPFDMIFCRNVMIYFSAADREQLVDKFVSALAPGGYLFIGHSERLPSKRDDLTMVYPTIYRRVQGG